MATMNFLTTINYNFTHVMVTHASFGDIDPIWFVNASPSELPVSPFFFSMAESILYWYVSTTHETSIPYDRDEEGYELWMVRPLGHTIEQIWNSMTIFENIKVLSYNLFSIWVNKSLSLLNISLRMLFTAYNTISFAVGQQGAYEYINIFGYHLSYDFFEQFGGNFSYGLSERESILFDVYNRWLCDRTNVYGSYGTLLNADLIRFNPINLDLAPYGAIAIGDPPASTTMFGNKYGWFFFPRYLYDYDAYSHFTAGRESYGIHNDLMGPNTGSVLPTFSIAAFIGIGVSVGLYLYGVNIDIQLPQQLVNT